MGNLPEPEGPQKRPAVPPVRVSDADREHVAVALQAAFAEGRLTMPELEERLAAIIGRITVVVPEDADVHIGGTGVIGGFDYHGEGPGSPGAPRITINGFAFCGNVVIERRPAHGEAPRPRLDAPGP